VQTTAATGLPSTYLGVGSTIHAVYFGTALPDPGGTVSGSYLFYLNQNVGNPFTGSPSVTGNRVNATATFTAGSYTYTSVGVGTWMNVGTSRFTAASYDSCSNITYPIVVVVRRIS
jgi:hypothetical protein